MRVGISLARELITWWESAQRKLPWRDDRTSYSVLVSEFMLQQTRIETVLPYFERWIERFPTVRELASVSEQELLAEWQGLGYYSRAKNLHRCAKSIVTNGWPRGKESWSQMPGVGEYTASALAAALGGEPEIAVDANLARVYARLNADGTSGEKLRKSAKALLEAQRGPIDADSWNQALMDLGSLICKPRRPDCEKCPVQSYCEAYRTNGVGLYPIRPTKPAPKSVYGQIYIAERQGKVGLRRIEEGNWWKEMWGPPFELYGKERITVLSGTELLGRIRAVVTNYRLKFDVLQVDPDDLRWQSVDLWVSDQESRRLPMPSPFRKALDRFSELSIFFDSK